MIGESMGILLINWSANPEQEAMVANIRLLHTTSTMLRLR